MRETNAIYFYPADDPRANRHVVMKFPAIDYVLIHRETDFQPWVAAYHYCAESGTWGQGHYFSKKENALEYINEKLKG